MRRHGASASATAVLRPVDRHWYGGAGVPDEAVAEGADEAAEIRAAAEEVVARLHGHRVPVRPTSTATFKTDHAYGTAQDAIAYVERLREAGPTR